MTRKLFGIAFVMTLAFAPVLATAADPPTEAEIAKLIVGKWLYVTKEGNVRTNKTTTTYRKDGTLSGQAAMGGFDLTFTGTWKVTGSKFITTYEKTDPVLENLVKRNTDDIIEINEKVYRFLTEKGKEMIATRVAD